MHFRACWSILTIPGHKTWQGAHDYVDIWRKLLSAEVHFPCARTSSSNYSWNTLAVGATAMTPRERYGYFWVIIIRYQGCYYLQSFHSNHKHVLLYEIILVEACNYLYCLDCTKHTDAALSKFHVPSECRRNQKQSQKSIRVFKAVVFYYFTFFFQLK